jgi:hypothetical protein
MTSSGHRARLARALAESAGGARKKPPEEGYLKEKRRIAEQNQEKTERLRNLRLAKEAQDREAAAALRAEPAEAETGR